MKTKATNEFPEIEWEIGDLLDRDIDERMEVFNAEGEDAEGNEYSGSAYYICDRFEEIKDIERL